MPRKRNQDVRHAIARRMAQGEPALSREDRRRLRKEKEQQTLERKIERMRFTLKHPSAPVPADISPEIIADENLVSRTEILRQLMNGVNANNIDPHIQRIIFFYGLDVKASFTERHDHTRACVATIAYYMRTGHARELDVAHLKAIVEHEHNPWEFAAREAFIRLFREGAGAMMQVGSQDRKRIDRARKYMRERIGVAAGGEEDGGEEEREGAGLDAAFEGFTLRATEEFDAVGSLTEKMELLKIMDGKTGALHELMQQLALSDGGDESMDVA